MSRKTVLPPAQNEIVLEYFNHNCPSCGNKMWHAYDNECYQELKRVENIQLRTPVFVIAKN